MARRLRLIFFRAVGEHDRIEVFGEFGVGGFGLLGNLHTIKVIILIIIYIYSI